MNELARIPSTAFLLRQVCGRHAGAGGARALDPCDGARGRHLPAVVLDGVHARAQAAAAADAHGRRALGAGRAAQRLGGGLLHACDRQLALRAVPALQQPVQLLRRQRGLSVRSEIWVGVRLNHARLHRRYRAAKPHIQWLLQDVSASGRRPPGAVKQSKAHASSACGRASCRAHRPRRGALAATSCAWVVAPRLAVGHGDQALEGPREHPAEALRQQVRAVAPPRPPRRRQRARAQARAAVQPRPIAPLAARAAGPSLIVLASAALAPRSTVAISMSAAEGAAATSRRRLPVGETSVSAESTLPPAQRAAQSRRRRPSLPMPTPAAARRCQGAPHARKLAVLSLP